MKYKNTMWWYHYDYDVYCHCDVSPLRCVTFSVWTCSHDDILKLAHFVNSKACWSLRKLQFRVFHSNRLKTKEKELLAQAYHLEDSKTMCTIQQSCLKMQPSIYIQLKVVAKQRETISFDKLMFNFLNHHISISIERGDRLFRFVTIW